MTPTAIIALVSAAGALLTAIIALSKRRPELAQVLVMTAEKVVVMQREEYEGRIDRLEAAMRDLEAKVGELTRSRDRYRNDLTAAERKVRNLQGRVEQLEQQLRAHDIPVPPRQDTDRTRENDH